MKTSSYFYGDLSMFGVEAGNEKILAPVIVMLSSADVYVVLRI